MALNIELPEDVENSLESRWRNLPRHTLESPAIEGYRARVLSRSQVRGMLGFRTGAEVDQFIQRAGVTFDYTVEDFEHDLRTLSSLREAKSPQRPFAPTKFEDVSGASSTRVGLRPSRK